MLFSSVGWRHLWQSWSYVMFWYSEECSFVLSFPSLQGKLDLHLFLSFFLSETLAMYSVQQIMMPTFKSRLHFFDILNFTVLPLWWEASSGTLLLLKSVFLRLWMVPQQQRQFMVTDFLCLLLSLITVFVTTSLVSRKQRQSVVVFIVTQVLRLFTFWTSYLFTVGWGQQHEERLWWPMDQQWKSFIAHTRWGGQLEKFFRQCEKALETGDAKPLNASQWWTQLWSAQAAQMARSKMEATVDRFLDPFFMWLSISFKCES